MKKFTSLCASGLLAALLGSSAQAASLAQIYQQALASDPQLKAAQAAFTAGQEREVQGRAGLLPQVGLSADSRYYDTDTSDFNNHGYTVSLSQPVFDASQWFSFKQGQALSRQAELTFASAQQGLVLRSVEAYLNVLRAMNNLQSAEAEVRAFKRRLDQVNVQFEVGMIAITDVRETQASYDNSRVRMIEARGALDNSFEALERLTGQPTVNPDRLRDDYPIVDLKPMRSEPWLNKALANNLQLRASQAATEAAQNAARSARAEHLPTLSLEASYDDDSGTEFGGVRTPQSETGMLGLKFEMPLYQGGLISSRSREAQAGLLQSRYQSENLRRAVTQQTRSLLRDLHTQVESVAARQQSIISSQTALRATEEGFEVGTRNVVDVLDAERTLYAAQRDYANARFDYIQTLFRFKQQLGTLSPEDLLALDQWLIATPVTPARG